ncbi:MAG: pyridoxamine 5'-phosphate oxidase family protein [Clostridia bacterium]|nr:pyridoxamine 5'-phosphate oxidase family protein [Clostridia bacterium]
MRRADREITDIDEITAVIKSCSCCRLGFNDDGEVYIIPLNFGFECKGSKITFYFHGAKEGRKIGLIENNPQVGFELDTAHRVYSLNGDGIACNYTAAYKSVIGTGKVSIVIDYEEKMHGLNLLMEQSTGKRNWKFDKNMLDSVVVFKLEADKFSCKEHK